MLLQTLLAQTLALGVAGVAGGLAQLPVMEAYSLVAGAALVVYVMEPELKPRVATQKAAQDTGDRGVHGATAHASPRHRQGQEDVQSVEAALGAVVRPDHALTTTVVQPSVPGDHGVHGSVEEASDGDEENA